jgi:hypothetical protein
MSCAFSAVPWGLANGFDVVCSSGQQELPQTYLVATSPDQVSVPAPCAIQLDCAGGSVDEGRKMCAAEVHCLHLSHETLMRQGSERM